MKKLEKSDLFHLLIDGNNLMHRAHHTLGKQTPNGSVIGFFRSLRTLINRFMPQQVVLCFDSCSSERLLRTEIFPDYKGNRRKRDAEKTVEETVFKVECLLQERLIITALQQAGFHVIFSPFHRIEADDWIACFVETAAADAKRNNYLTIVSSDKDLWQLISPTVNCYNPISDKLMTYNAFRGEYGIEPGDWATVKMLAGDPSDNIPGIPGVGIETACKFVRISEKLSDKKKQAIIAFMRTAQYRINKQLVTLPIFYPDCLRQIPYPNLKEFSPPLLDSRGWDDILAPYVANTKEDGDAEKQPKGRSV